MTRAVYPNLFMRHLSIPAFLNEGHDNVLSCHEWELLSNASGNDHGVDHQTFRNVLQRREDDVGSEESFWEGNTSVCAAKRCLVLIGVLGERRNITYHLKSVRTIVRRRS
jgi:hypothetical protein